MSVSIKTIRTAAEAAKEFRANLSFGAGQQQGFVMVYRGVPFRWSSDLAQPKTVRPGVIAVPPEGMKGRIYQAVGGNDANGAQEFACIFDPAP